ncbi:MAG: hypothetical protein Q4B58_00840 [Bacteroidales bacterium]|nr:hypothetical protein [Bacteroidales bacterium]
MIKAMQKSSLLALCILLLSACSGTTDYFVSKDVDYEAWSETDSVFFPIEIVETPDVLNPVKYGYDYTLTLACRHSYDYKYQSIPLTVSFEVLDDSLGWRSCINPMYISIPTTDEKGFFTGGGWGSLYNHELPVKGRTFSFPAPGNYRIIVQPDAQLRGVVSMTVQLQ